MPCTEHAASENYADFIAYYYSSREEFMDYYGTRCVDFINDTQAVIYAPLSSVLPLTLSRYTYSAIPKLYSLLDASSMEAAGISEASRLPAFSNEGDGVLIGFVDTGIDYTNPLFQQNGASRIIGIWDQTIGSGSGDGGGNNARRNGVGANGGFQPLYGTMFTRDEISQALQSEDPFSLVPSRDEIGHGTFLSSLAAGSPDEAAGFSGAAPKAYLAMVKLKPAKQYLREFYLIRDGAHAYQENDIMMGISYLYSLSRQYSLPLVLCLCLGTNQGSHEGTSPLCQYLNNVSAYAGTAVITAAGNETGMGHHYRGVMEQPSAPHVVEITVAEQEQGFSMEFWAQDIEIYTIGFISPTGEVIRPLPASTTDDHMVTFLLEKTSIRVYYQIADFSNGSQLIFIRFQEPSPGIWRIVVSASLNLHGTFHLWLPGREFLSEGTFFLRPDPDTTIMEPGNARAPITLTAYNHETGGIYIHASRGYSRSGQIKPELTAPGVNILGASVSGPPFVRMTGTSAAAAHAAGAAASFLSWGVLQGNYPYMNTSVLKTLFIRGAKRNPELPYPNREFGYGTLDLTQSFLQLRRQ